MYVYMCVCVCVYTHMRTHTHTHTHICGLSLTPEIFFFGSLSFFLWSHTEDLLCTGLSAIKAFIFVFLKKSLHSHHIHLSMII